MHRQSRSGGLSPVRGPEAPRAPAARLPPPADKTPTAAPATRRPADCRPTAARCRAAAHLPVSGPPARPDPHDRPNESAGSGWPSPARSMYAVRRPRGGGPQVPRVRGDHQGPGWVQGQPVQRTGTRPVGLADAHQLGGQDGVPGEPAVGAHEASIDRFPLDSATTVNRRASAASAAAESAMAGAGAPQPQPPHGCGQGGGPRRSAHPPAPRVHLVGRHPGALQRSRQRPGPSSHAAASASACLARPGRPPSSAATSARIVRPRPPPCRSRRRAGCHVRRSDHEPIVAPAGALTAHPGHPPTTPATARSLPSAGASRRRQQHDF